MSLLKHKSADEKHYDKEAESYDAVNEKNSLIINKTIEGILKDHQVNRIVDFTCGTGSQVFYLHKKGYDVSGFDINKKMLRMARKKVKTNNLQVTFKQGDIRNTYAGQFDAVISIFNAIGHLTKADFQKALVNISKNLKQGGLYLFDNFNLNYLLDGDNICKLTMDVKSRVNNKDIREIQYSTIDSNGVLASFDTYIESTVGRKPKLSYAEQTLQTYSEKMLREILLKNGFKVIKKCNPDGSKFSDKKSERVFIVAKKISRKS